MNSYAPTLDTALETEEFVTAEEFLRRREHGEITPADVRYVPQYPGTPFGGFMIKLKTPRSLRAIEANITNKRELRTHLDNNNKRGMILTIVLSFFLLIFGLAALYLDKESILTDLLKILCGFLGGSGLGYAIGTRKRPPNA